MKQHLTTLLWTLLLLLVAETGRAQSAALQTSKVFDGNVVPTERMILTRVRGKALSKYQLSYYRSARFKASTAEAEEVADIVAKDKALCDRYRLSSQTVKRNHDGIKTESLVFSLPPENGLNRFISLVTEKGSGGQTLVTVIYMEGKVKDVNQLSRLIGK